MRTIKVTAKCNNPTDSQFTCEFTVSDIQTTGNYTLTSIKPADKEENTFIPDKQTISLEIVKTYTLGTTQTASQTINKENDSF